VPAEPVADPTDTQIDTDLRAWLWHRHELDRHGLANERTLDRRAHFPGLVDAVEALRDWSGDRLYPGDPRDLDTRPRTAAMDAAAAEIRGILHHHLIPESEPS
jgi:hypothetical protein